VAGMEIAGWGARWREEGGASRVVVGTVGNVVGLGIV
jgi:hypothetical protein